ncbi:nuclear pore protein 84/107 [Basidiobolus meristosporus CBS 931.73]|uniref:Nuclear pore complex protein n=1 Tax=Basidiobolus meristosporus CBS 931.73 TaxID=1314790 RepID=A0A1Y1Y5E9_9FUNG|nr:nuclear pore protein 84/107 [Basidiobolus meristosporus CBS 931.73]|eukprot:ORX93251.1 nuclear pore protein 84/107 [Basidiobolus meristosporus CBS 931.73]
MLTPNEELEIFAQTLEDASNSPLLDDECGLGVSLENICNLRVQELQDQEANAYQYTENNLTEEIEHWVAEGNTWKLVHLLFSERFSRDDLEGLEVPDVENSYIPDFKLVQNLFRNNREISENNIVRSWLEDIAPAFQPVETRRGYWFHTGKCIGSKSKLGSSFMHSRNENLVTEIDPDAPNRQNKELALEDNMYEKSLVRTLYEYIRRGRIEDATDLCRESDQPWRAASISGGVYHDDPLLGDDVPVGIEALEPRGNVNRGLWKGTCYQLAKEESLDVYERAMYAALCGDVENLLPVCKSWEDYIWGYYNALIENQVEQNHRNTESAELPIPAFEHMTKEDIFMNIAKSPNEALSALAKDPYRYIQTMIILSRIDELIIEMSDTLTAHTGLWQTSEEPPVDPRILRFLTHMVLYLRTLGIELPAAEANNIIKCYVELLIQLNKNYLVAFYTSKLPEDLQVEVYSTFLAGIEDDAQDRYELIKLAYRYNLDVTKISSRTVEKVFQEAVRDDLPDFDLDTFDLKKISDPVEAQDKAQISALDWLTFENYHYEEALKQSNTLVRRFLICGKINGANEVFRRLPQDFLLTEWMELLENEVENNPIVSNVQEHLHYRSFCECIKLYDLWSETFYERPVKSEGVQAMQKSNDWRNKMKSITLKNEEVLQRLLESDWLSSSYARELPSIEQERRHYELDKLRETFIPEIVFRLHTVLYETRDLIPENLEKSLDIVNIVADDKNALYREFVKSKKIPQLLELLRQSSLELLKHSQNPFKLEG